MWDTVEIFFFLTVSEEEVRDHSSLVKDISLHIQQQLKLPNWNTYKEHHPWAHQSEITKIKENI